MLELDEFKFSLQFGQWLFTFGLGLALGLVIAAGVLWWRKRAVLPPALLAGASVLFGLASLLLVYDAGPYSPVEFRFRPYLSHVADAGALVSALVVGAAASFAIALASRRFVRRDSLLLLPVALTGLALAAVLWRVDLEARPHGRHPQGTDAGRLVEATRVIDQLEIPTGLAIAPDGTVAIVELSTASLRIFVPEGAAFREVAQSRLPTGDGGRGFHVTFHPDYPAQPYVYVSAAQQLPEGQFMQVVRGRVETSTITFTSLIERLPLATVEGNGNHYGSAVTFCGGYFFLSVGDTEDELFHSRDFDNPNVVRTRAQGLGNPYGKILRWRLAGIELEAAPLIDGAIPIYAFGFRNPFGITCDEQSGLPVVGENGARGHDQVRIVPPGSNHEWPLSDSRDLLAKPLLDTRDVSVAPTGVAMRDTETGREILLSGYFSQAIYALPLATDGEPGRLRLLREVEGGAFSVATTAAGCVYFTDVDSLWRLDDGRCE